MLASAVAVLVLGLASGIMGKDIMKRQCNVLPCTASASDIAGTVALHNNNRALETTATAMYALTWNVTLAQLAQYWANNIAASGNMAHGNLYLCSGPKMGQNIYSSSSSNTTGWYQAAIAAWMSEKAGYNYATNTCSQSMCGHYTQVVWGNTTQVGCAYATGSSGLMVVCNYYPPGNMNSEWPYASGVQASQCNQPLPGSPAGYGYIVSGGLCQYCPAGSTGCTCYASQNGGTQNPNTCISTCPTGYTDPLCGTNCIDRATAKTCTSWLTNCPQAVYSAFMQSNCPCTCTNNGYTGYTCCPSTSG